MLMKWKNAGAELPPKWKKAVSDHNKSLLGQRGLGRYAWCVAAEVLLCLPPERLRELAAKHRDLAERDWESFHDKWVDRDDAWRAVAVELLDDLTEALRSAAPKRKSRAQKKS